MFVLYWMESFRRLDFLNLRRIEDERTRHHQLLARILPRSVIERLERGEQRIADEFPESTVLFADIVGFTEISARHKPAEIVELLNGVFGRFDELVEQHGVEKIKTIGDAYMAAGGVPDRRPGHSGPLIAGVIGESRFGYDRGNTVNTASRMESHGVPGASSSATRSPDA
jgi:adenylate cyclase